MFPLSSFSPSDPHCAPWLWIPTFPFYIRGQAQSLFPMQDPISVVFTFILIVTPHQALTKSFLLSLISIRIIFSLIHNYICFLPVWGLFLFFFCFFFFVVFLVFCFSSHFFSIPLILKTTTTLLKHLLRVLLSLQPVQVHIIYSI